MTGKSVFEPEERASLINQWMNSNKTMKEFCEAKAVNVNTFAGWVKSWHQTGGISSSASQVSKKKSQKRAKQKLQSLYITDIIDGDFSFQIFAIGRCK